VRGGVTDATRKLLRKAERAIGAAGRLLEAGDADFAAARVYYAMFYVAAALLGERGFRFKKHSGVHAAFGQHFASTGELDAKFHRWLLDAFDKRVFADYGVDIAVEREDVEQMMAQAREFLEVARQRLEPSSP
jgi:uncharacterized protein (UPF0332 family)